MTLAVHSSGPVAVPSPLRRGLSRVEAAGYVGVSPSTFDKMISDGMMPGAKRIYSRRIWDVRALDLAFEALGGDNADDTTWDDVDAAKASAVR